MSDLTPDETEAERKDNLEQLRQAADDGKQARADADLARRELAFAKAGIDTDTGVGKLLFQSYQGDASKDAVLAAAAEYGITFTKDEPAPVVEITAEERAQSRERAQLAAQSEPPTGETATPDPSTEGLRQFRQGRDEGLRLEDAGASFFHTVIAAAMSGDKRAQFDPAEYAARAGEG